MKDEKSAGFTLVELLIICPMLMAIIAFLMTYLFNLYGQLVTQNAQVNLQVQAQSIVFSMQDDVFFANAFVSDLNNGLSDTYAPSGGWTKTTNPTTFITSTPALTANHRNPNRQPVYINTLGCSPDSVKTQNDALFNNVIYFANGSNLYKRVITAPSSMSTCGTSYLKQSCPDNHASSSCPSDVLLTNQLQSFTITYVTSSDTTTTTPEQATKVKVDLTLTDTAYAKTVTANNNVTLRRINQ